MSISRFVPLAACAREARMGVDAFVAFLNSCPGVALEVRSGRRGLFDFDLAIALDEIAERKMAGAAHARNVGA